mmetsp:Transcript_30066/g.62856  ORF Transcript_30066/g.62856 Transcript_30066/m.62856 type:complete len:223 (+) Transcript_30066:251-919(+)
MPSANTVTAANATAEFNKGREKICLWAYGIVDHCDLDRRLVSIALSYFDRLLSNGLVDERDVPENNNNARLAGMTCLYLAIKIHSSAVVSARRQRLQVDSQPDLNKEGPNRSDGTAKAAGLGAAKPQQQSLIKTCSHGDESTAGTSDETDKSSTTSSSWSRNDSPMTFPSQQQTTTFLQAMHGGISGPALPGLDREGCHSCPPPMRPNDINEDDSFIFQLDM